MDQREHTLGGDDEPVGSSKTEELLASYAAGDNSALGQLLARERPWMIERIARKMPDALRQRLGVSDVFQATAIELMAVRERFENLGARAFRSLAATIADRSLSKAIRREQALKRQLLRTLQTLPPLAGDATAPRSLVDFVAADETSASRAFLRREDADRVRRGFQQLPLAQRTILRLIYFEGQESAQLAEILGVSAETARQRHHRALLALKAIVAREDRGGL